MQNICLSNSLRQSIRRADYVSALQLLQNFPEEAVEGLDTQAEYALLHLLENITVKKLKPDLNVYLDLFRSLLRAFPPAIDANLLLHRACAFVTTCPILISARNGCIRIIIEEHPVSVLTRSEHNWLPLHCACFSNVSFDILEVLIQVAPHTAWSQNDGGSTALNILWDRYAMDDSYSCILSPYRRDDAFCVDLWDKVLLLVEAAFASDDSFSTKSSFHPLLGFASIPHTTIEMMNLALVKYKGGVRWSDPVNGGNNILHMCASFNRSATHNIASRCSNKGIIQTILQIDVTVAKQVNNCGRYPFMCAVLSGMEWEDGLSDIFRVFPDAAMIQDRETGLFPFMAAHSISTIYQILRELPSMIAVFAKNR